MPHRNKTHRIKRSRPSALKQPKLPQTSGDSPDEQNQSQRQVPENFKEEAPIKRAVKIDPRNICNLSEEERAKIKLEHPEMNEYFLMTARDKSKYFHLLNQKYRKDMRLAQPPGSAPMKKTIKFKKRFQIRGFSYLQKCDEIKETKSFMELYKAKDENKSKPISKFPRGS